jgi:hypothetical protein
MTQAGPAPAADAESNTFYISVLGRRVGPLSKLQARDLAIFMAGKPCKTHHPANISPALAKQV